MNENFLRNILGMIKSTPIVILHVKIDFLAINLKWENGKISRFINLRARELQKRILSI